MNRKTFLRNLLSKEDCFPGGSTHGAFSDTPTYLTNQEVSAILREMGKTDASGYMVPLVDAQPSNQHLTYVALSTIFPEKQRVQASCAGLCYLQILCEDAQEVRVRVAALPSHFEALDRHKVSFLIMTREQFRQILPWDRTLQRLETCCVRDVLQVYVSRISGGEVVAHPYALDVDGLPVQALAPSGQKESADVVGEMLPEQVFVPANLALNLASQLTARDKQGQKTMCSPRFFWLKAIIMMLEKLQQPLSTFETMLLRMVRYLKKNRHGGFQIQETPVRKEKTCLGWSLLLGFPQTTLRRWGF